MLSGHDPDGIRDVTPPASRRPPFAHRAAAIAGKLAGSLAVALLFGELAVRALDPPTSRNLRPTELYVPATGALSYTLQPGYSGPAYGAHVEVNSRGFRGPEIAQDVPPGTRRLVLLGDSVAFGFGVEQDESLGSRLADDLRARGAPVDVVNLGVPGYNLAQELEVWRRHGAELAPDVVVLVLGRNDADPNIVRDLQGDPHSLGARVHAVERWLRSHSRLVGLLDHAAWRHAMESAVPEARASGPPATDPEAHAAFAAAFEALIAEFQGRGTPLVVTWYDPPAPLADELAALCARSDVPLAMLMEDLPEPITARRWRLGWDSHPSAEAQAHMARRLGAFLTAEVPEALGLPPNR